jgi:diguanylate cyclase (GGDEF)-like protein
VTDTDSMMEKPTVLIVDDSPDDLALISGILNDSYKVKIANSGERALKVVMTDTPPDIILLDIMMPVMDGYETCHHLKASPESRDIPIIFLTSKTEIEDEIMGFEFGAVDYITKPISPPVVLARVRTHLQLKQARDYLKDKNEFLEAEVQQRIQAEERIRHTALHDSLTGLPTRVLFGDRLQQAISNAHREKTLVAVMYIDLDKFKPVNDTFGHGVGDLLLKGAGERMLNCLRESDTVARIGGDEFVVILRNIKKDDEAVSVAEKIRHALNQPFELADQNLSISSSIGIAIYPEHGSHEIELTKNADSALYNAKKSGRDKVMVFQLEKN